MSLFKQFGIVIADLKILQPYWSESWDGGKQQKSSIRITETGTGDITDREQYVNRLDI